jgi:predicted MFS family arabinose efflux permease
MDEHPITCALLPRRLGRAAIWYLGARVLAGGFSALVWGMVAGYARRLVPGHQAGRAMAVALVGTPVALAIGVPLGTFAGSLVGWRWTFAGMSLLSAILIVWIAVAVPDRPRQDTRNRSSIAEVMLIPGVSPWMSEWVVMRRFSLGFDRVSSTGAR